MKHIKIKPTQNIHIRKDVSEDFAEAAAQFATEYRSESCLSPVMVACFLARFGGTPEVRAKAEKEIESIKARLGI